MHLQLDKVLFSFILLFTSAVLWCIWRFIWPYRKIPNIFFSRKMLMAFLQGKHPYLKCLENECAELGGAETLKRLTLRPEGPESASMLISDPLNAIVYTCKIFEKEGLFYAFYMEPIVFVFNEEYTKILLNEDALLDKPWQYKVFSEFAGNGLLLHHGNIWKKRRKMINPAFNFEMLKNYVSTFNRCARHAVDRLSMLVDHPTSDVLHILKTTFLKAIWEIVFGKEMNGEENERKIAQYDDIITRLGSHTVYRGFRPWRYFKKLEFLYDSGRKHQKDYEDCHNFTKHLIEETMKDITSDIEDLRIGEFEGRSPFHLLLRHHLDDPMSFTMENIRHEIQNVILAGHHTLTHTTHWCLINISLHPEIQQKAFEEVESVLGSGNSDITYEDLNNLKYLDSIIKETLRLYPSVPYFSRLLTDDVQCGKYKIPKSTVISFVVPLLHRNPDIYPNPDKFDPDRFHNKLMKHPWAFVPFAEGIRSCIGKNFAMLEMKVLLSHILRNFEVSLEDKDKEIKAKWNVVLETASPVRFLLTRR